MFLRTSPQGPRANRQKERISRGNESQDRIGNTNKATDLLTVLSNSTSIKLRSREQDIVILNFENKSRFHLWLLYIVIYYLFINYYLFIKPFRSRIS